MYLFLSHSLSVTIYNILFDTLKYNVFLFFFLCSSSPRKKSHSHGSKRIFGSVRQVETHTRYRQYQKENQDNQIVIKSCMERDHYVVSVDGFNFNYV